MIWLTEREKQILGLIKKNPMISQKELADILGIARSSVAVHITNLTKKGYIKGKGYILKENEYVTVVGGTNIDIQGFTKNKLVLQDSNPGKVKISLGGVGRNIAENLVKLGVDVKLFSAVGNDMYGRRIIEECRVIGIDIDNVLILDDAASSTYLCILNEMGDMEVAISDMDIFNKITPEYIKNKKYIIKNSQVIVVDTNVPKGTLEYLVTNFSDKVFFLDTVSTTKAMKVKDIIGYFHTIKPNKIETEVLTGIKINGLDDLRKASHYFLNKGVKRVFISLGSEGIFYEDENKFNLIKPPSVKIVNTTGAGDAFLAALVYSYINQFSIYESARFGMAASVLALSHENTINPYMSVEKISKIIKEMI